MPRARRPTTGPAEERLQTLVAGIAHEINNPLTYLAGNLELALLDLKSATEVMRAHGIKDGPDLEETARGVANALAGADRIAALTRALDTIAGGRSAKTRGPVRASFVIANVASLLKEGLDHRIGFRVENAPPEPVVLAASEDIQLIVLHLARNGIDAVRERGHGNVTVATRGVPGALEIAVSDDGPGLTAEARERLFTPFYTTRATGAGLGLAVVRSLVDGLGGHMDVESAPGKGARFTVRLPSA